MAQTAVSVCLVLTLSLIQGVSCQEWGVNLTHYHICAVSRSSVVMPCSFNHPPNLTVAKVFWAKDPQPATERTDLSNNPEYKDRVLYSGTKNCTMTLKHIKLSDAGFYHPRIVTNIAKQKWLGQPGLNLFITELSVWIPRPVVEGREVKMSCNNSCSPAQKPTVIWRKNGVDVSAQQTKHDQLILGRVSVEDEGNYSCALKSFQGYPSKPVRLNVMFSPKNTTLSITSTDKILKGTSVTLTCSSDANPPVENYTWFKVNQSTPVGSGQQYSITNISFEDGGQYYCEARNKYGADNSTVKSITVEGPPNHTSASVSPSGDLKEGTSVTLTCSSDVTPPVENFTWFYSDGSTASQVGAGKYYMIGQGSSEHNGYYYCEAKNKHGASNSTDIHLIFHYAPRNTSVSMSPSGEIVDGSSVTLTCSSDANPPVENYTWFKVDDSTPVGSGQQYSIANISSEDGGQYYCEARNKYGAENSTAVLMEIHVDHTLVMYVVIGVSSGCGLLGLLFFIRLKCKAEKIEETNQVNDIYDNDTFDHNTDIDSVYQNYTPGGAGNEDDDDEIYQNA
ncbi:B-cell receptor CD22-like [Alosa pseudoharengus]|uniref:B-cell receptor CD22-like n=1 Tax=Alosa pseudoharengus TaxID=34774 RepID=UPI003F8AC9BE